MKTVRSYVNSVLATKHCIKLTVKLSHKKFSLPNFLNLSASSKNFEPESIAIAFDSVVNYQKSNLSCSSVLNSILKIFHLVFLCLEIRHKTTVV